MMARVLLDTGPLVAILSRRDDYHAVCVEQLRQLSPPLLTCWPVLTEAAWLLRKEPLAIQRLFQGFETGLLKLMALDETAAPWIATFLHRYRQLGAQLADACLVYLAEHERYRDRVHPGSPRLLGLSPERQTPAQHATGSLIFRAEGCKKSVRSTLSPLRGAQ